MANKYTAVLIQLVFVVKNRKALILPQWELQLFKYITGIIQKKGHRMIAVNGMPDHIHILLGLNTDQAISNLVMEIKKNTSRWIKENNLSPMKFERQKGYGVLL